jgi:hypothetical protein
VVRMHWPCACPPKCLLRAAWMKHIQGAPSKPMRTACVLLCVCNVPAVDGLVLEEDGAHPQCTEEVVVLPTLQRATTHRRTTQLHTQREDMRE